MIVKNSVLAFLQNPWFKPGTASRYVKMYRDNQEFHRRVLAMSATGKALRRALGEDVFRRINWSNASSRHGTTHGHVEPPDPIFMAGEIIKYMPDVLLLFGRQAQAGWELLRPFTEGHGGRMILRAPHPMARGSATSHLKDIAARVKMLYA